MFLRNIFLGEVLEKSQNIKTLKDYYDSFSLFLIICGTIEIVINKGVQLDEVNNEYLIKFLDKKCSDILDFNDLKEEISKMEIRNQKSKSKKTTLLQIYAFIYFRLMDFSLADFEFQTIASTDFFESVYKIFNNEYNIDHLHVTGEIRGYVHQFCNLRLKENTETISCFAHNLFGFELYFIIKEIRISTWGSKNLSIGGSCLTKVNYANFDNFKFIDTFKYF